jgi:hypothetical protein
MADSPSMATRLYTMYRLRRRAFRSGIEDTFASGSPSSMEPPAGCTRYLTEPLPDDLSSGARATAGQELALAGRHYDLVTLETWR